LGRKRSGGAAVPEAVEGDNKENATGRLTVKLRDYDRLVAAQASRRTVLKGAAGLGAALGTTGLFGPLSSTALAQGDLRAQILQIPGVGKGSPTDADWQKVGELCLGPTKAAVKEGEFKGVKLSFMGLNNQNLHNLLFRGFLKPWEAYTGAEITWIDLAQADYNPRLQQAIATGTVDFDIVEMGAPFEGDVCGKAWRRRCRTGSRSRSRWTIMSAI
jgi:multiple sugar transport system substrate-binding protein